MKKKYETPKAEKFEFNYGEIVTASGAEKNYNDDPNGQYYKCTGETYYAPGWGLNC